MITSTGDVDAGRRDQGPGAPADQPSSASPATRRGFGWVTVVVPALAAYVPLLLTHAGMVGADTKTYLYLDPGKLLEVTSAAPAGTNGAAPSLPGGSASLKLPDQTPKQAPR